MRELHNFIQNYSTNCDRIRLKPTSHIDTLGNPEEYISRVEKALVEINKGQYIKVIPSRVVNIQDKVDMPATLLLGRGANSPARTFSLNHAGFQATGFSPELVLSVQHGKVITEPLAGTRSYQGSKAEVEQLRRELLNDPKEIVEHVISVKEAIGELDQLYIPHTITIDNFMSVHPHGPIQHLDSSIAGTLSPDKDM